MSYSDGPQGDVSDLGTRSSGRADAEPTALVGPVIIGHSPPIGRRGSAPAGSQVVRVPGLQTRPLGGGTSIGTQRVLMSPCGQPVGESSHVSCRP